MTYFIGIIIALLVAIAVSKDANNRGMDGLAWAIGVFALMIIFLPLYFIMRKPKLDEVE